MGRWPLPGDAFRTYLDSWDDEFTAPGASGVMYEITATYLHTPGAACRVRALLPDARFVVVLRDPVTRALSHWNMQMDLYRWGWGALGGLVEQYSGMSENAMRYDAMRHTYHT